MKQHEKWLTSGLMLLLLNTAMEGKSVAGIVTSVQAAGVQSTPLSGAVTEMFNSKSAGDYSTLSTAVGTLSSAGSFAIVKADQYGGAGGTGEYLALGAESGSTSPVTLTFNGPEAAFGMWWSAADSNNTVSIYSGSTLLETFTASSLFGSLSNSYNGNPTSQFLGQDSDEKFAYIDFSANGGPAFTSVVFGNSNTTATGFEIDNLSVATVPEPGSLALAATGLGFLVGLAWLEFKRAQLRRRVCHKS